MRCEGCYNHFGDTAQHGGLVTADEVATFAKRAKIAGLAQATVAGGDPLFHPEIVRILQRFKAMGLRVKLDTVGTSFLGEAKIVFKGKGVTPAVAVADIAPYVDFVNVPLDGSSQKTLGAFRKGRPHLFDETRKITSMLRAHHVHFGYNTVANTSNIHELEAIRTIAEEDGADEWQVFEYDPKGPNPSREKDALTLHTGEFEAAVLRIPPSQSNMKVDFKNLQDRTGAYFLIDDSGHAWKPSGAGQRFIVGHIINDQNEVIDAWERHVIEMHQEP